MPTKIHTKFEMMARVVLQFGSDIERKHSWLSSPEYTDFRDEFESMTKASGVRPTFVPVSGPGLIEMFFPVADVEPVVQVLMALSFKHKFKLEVDDFTKALIEDKKCRDSSQQNPSPSPTTAS